MKTQLQRADVLILHLVCKNKTKHIPLHLIFFIKQMGEKKLYF